MLLKAASLTRDAVQSFLKRSRLVPRFGSRVPPSPVESKVRETIHSWDLDIPEDILEKSIANGLDVGFMGYRHTPYELQVIISLFTACNFLFDDCVVPPEALQQFGRRFYRQLPQLHPVLDKFIEMAVALGDYYPLYSADMIYAGTFQYGSEEILLSERSDISTLRPGATEYIEYSRLKGGIPEPFAYCAWPSSICPDINEYIQAIPEALVFTNFINDVFSFYKESIADDTANYVHQYARVHDKTIAEALHDTMERLIAAVEKVLVILGEG